MEEEYLNLQTVLKKPIIPNNSKNVGLKNKTELFK